MIKKGFSYGVVVVRLSPQVYRSPSVAAIRVGTHETGHAIQHKESYLPLKLGNLLHCLLRSIKTAISNVPCQNTEVTEINSG